LLVLNFDATQLRSTKANLVFLVDTDTKIDYLQEKASIYVQKYPEKTVYDELLLWVFVQQKKFNSAFRQASAMDRRNKTEGKNLIDLAIICLSNKNYAVAIKCYDKIIDFGADGYFYLNAKMGSLETNYKLISETGQYTSEDLNLLINRYLAVLTLFGKSPQTAKSMKQLSDLYIYYKHDLDSGVSILESLVVMPRLQQKTRGAYKLALGDAMLMKNEVWDATLLYGQVDKAFKEDPLGQEAKFRNAKLSFYRGDFEWSKDQLDVLKTATSQLISNNAIELSLLIKDNTGLDSSTEAMAAFAHAQLLLFQNKLEESLEELNQLPFKYPKHALEDEIYYVKAQIYEKQRKYTKAEEYYNTVVKFFSDDILADNALYALAQLYDLKLNQPKKALEMYERIIFDYNSSLFVVDARKRYKALKRATQGAKSQ
jgi:tetratricopeptide (TPR) repeat protein